MGSTPHAHATAKVSNPCEQGIIAMMGVFIDTFIILTMTALVILSTGVLGNGQTGAELAQSAFNVGFGDFGNIFIAIDVYKRQPYASTYLHWSSPCLQAS